MKQNLSLVERSGLGSLKDLGPVIYIVSKIMARHAVVERVRSSEEKSWLRIFSKIVDVFLIIMPSSYTKRTGKGGCEQG